MDRRVESLRPHRADHVLFAFVFLFFLLPLTLSVARMGVRADLFVLGGDFPFIVGRSVLFTLLQAALSALLAFAVGGFLGLGLAFAEGRVAQALSRLLAFLGPWISALPGATLALLLLELAWTSGGLLPDRGLVAVVLAHVLFNVLLVAASVEQRVRAQRGAGGMERMEAAATMGARGLSLWRVAWEPLLRSEGRVWLPLIFLWSFSAFSTVIILGGSPQAASPEVLLYFTLQNDFEGSRILLLMLVQLGMGFVLMRFSRQQADEADALAQADVPPPRTLPRGMASWRALSVAAYGVFAFIVALLLGGLLGAWSERAADGATAVRASWDLAAAARNSLALALGTALLTTLLFVLLLFVSPAARRRAFWLAAFSPTFVMAAWMGVGIDLWAQDSWLGQILLCSAALAALQMPWMALWLERRVRAVPPEHLAAARVSGASEGMMVRKILWPQVRDVFANAVTLSALTALGDMAVSGLLLREGQTLTALSRAMAQRYDFSGTQWVLWSMIGMASLFWLVRQGVRRRRP